MKIYEVHEPKYLEKTDWGGNEFLPNNLSMSQVEEKFKDDLHLSLLYNFRETILFTPEITNSEWFFPNILPVNFHLGMITAFFVENSRYLLGFSSNIRL